MPTDYNAIQAINWSSLKHMGTSPLHYRHALESPPPDTSTFAFGRLVHTLILEPDTFHNEYAIFDGAARRGKVWEAFKEANEGKTILKLAEVESAQEMAKAVRDNHALTLGHLSHVEQVITWTDEATGLECKGRFDGLTKWGMLFDLKTAQDISRRGFTSAIARYGYAAQAAFYMDGARAMGLDVNGWAWLVVEKSAPYDNGLLHASEEMIKAGRNHYRELLGAVKRCHEMGAWPGRYASAVTLDPPAWMDGMPELPTDEIEV
jgi:hypothetical protein